MGFYQFSASRQCARCDSIKLLFTAHVSPVSTLSWQGVIHYIGHTPTIQTQASKDLVSSGQDAALTADTSEEASTRDYWSTHLLADITINSPRKHYA
jgi:hypothetical protein